MQKVKKLQKHKKVIFKTVCTFVISYLIFLILWIQVKDYYGKGILFTASQLIAGIKDVTFEEISEEKDKDIIQATFSPLRHGSNILIDIPVKTSSYTFNAPLTFAIMASLYLFIRKKGRAYGEALLILFFVHLLYVFSFEAKELTKVFIEMGLEAVSKPRIFAYQFLWSFTDNMVIRFEPFLIGFYMFIRFRNKS